MEKEMTFSMILKLHSISGLLQKINGNLLGYKLKNWYLTQNLTTTRFWRLSLMISVIFTVNWHGFPSRSSQKKLL